MTLRCAGDGDGETERRRSVPVAALLCAVLVLASSPIALAQGGGGAEPPSEGAQTPASDEAGRRPAGIDAEIARLEALRDEWLARTRELARARTSAPTVLASIQADVAELRRGAEAPVDAGRPIDELDSDLVRRESELAAARKQASALETEAAGRAARRQQIPELLASARARLLALEDEGGGAADIAGPPEARQRLARVRREAVEREIEAYEEELRSYDARGQLLTLRREQAALRVSVLERQRAQLRDLLAARRQDEAEIAAEQAQRALEAAEELPPIVQELVRDLAEQNRELALQRTGDDGLVHRIDDTSRKLARAEEQVAEVSADLEILRRNMQIAGLSGSSGVLLHRTRAGAPDVGKYRRFIRMRRDRIVAVQEQQVDLAARRQALANVDAIVEDRMAELGPDLSPEDRAAAETLIRDLLETQRRSLDTLIDDTETYFVKLVDFDARQQELVARTESLLRFIDERILWIPSGGPLSPGLGPDARAALAWLFTARFWGQLGRAASDALSAAPLISAGALLLLLATPLARPRLRELAERLGQEAGRPECTRIELSGGALVLSLLLAAWGPGLLAFLGWRLGISRDATLFVRCFSGGLLAASFVWASLQLVRELLARNGIAQAHLGWPGDAVRELRSRVGWLAAVLVPGAFAIAVFEIRGEDAWTQSVGRLAFLVTIGAVGIFNHRVLREGGALRRLLDAGIGSRMLPWVWRLLHASAVVLALGLAVGAVRGYFWTALQLTASFHVTFVFLFLLSVVYGLGSRWALLASRRLALRRWEEARRVREEHAADAPDANLPDLEEPEVDLATVDAQTGRLLHNAALLSALIGVWMIWADLLPIAGTMRSIDLWTTTTTATVELTNAAGETITNVEQRRVPITMADLLLALVIGAATLALARNLPGLLEVSVFRQLRTRPGERYAYATIGKYGVTLAGVLAALHHVGFGWANIQWLLAAVGLGLGFGLQEIFANFISGLIILFERPIRVGDTVTVGDVSGTVTKIRIRATWITGFDRKELVVPNKEFVTGRLVNWSLSDAVLRVEIPVGIAYGSDTEKASRVLREVAEADEHVLREPPPYVLFRGFGDSSLSFELRVFSPDVAHYLEIVHGLHMEIDRRFRSEGIEIAFPQRDLHVRSLPVPRAEAAADARGAESPPQR